MMWENKLGLDSVFTRRAGTSITPRRRRIGAYCCSILGCLALMAPAQAGSGTASFTGIGDIPGGSFNSEATGISPDGSVVIGLSINALFQFEAFRLEGGVMTSLGDLPGGGPSLVPAGISNLGLVIVGSGSSSNGGEAFRWEAGAIAGLDDFPGGTISGTGFNSLATAVSANGSVVVGQGESVSGNEAFRWTALDGLVPLGDLEGGIFESGARGVSADGSVVTGFSKSGAGIIEAFRWTAGEGMTGLGDLDGGLFVSQAHAISADGLVIVGHGETIAGSELFRWTQADGMVGHGDLPGGAVFAKGLDVSGDGSVIVGVGTVVNFFDTAFIWTAGGGIRSLKDVLETDFGLDLTGWQLTEATGISDDGMTVVGAGTNPDGFQEGWIATLGDLGGGCDPLVDCSGNGVCDPTTDLCICDVGWTGPSCDVPVCNPACVNGQCVAPDLCVCDVGWTGDDCSVPLVLDAFIDVRPDRCPNAISIAGAGNLPMLMIGAAAFDVADVNLDSLLLHRADGVGGSVAPMARAGGVRARFADRGTPPEAPCACGSAGPDGLTDALINFRLTTMIDLLELGAEPTGTIVSVLLTGELVNGLPFSAEDCITIRP